MVRLARQVSLQFSPRGGIGRGTGVPRPSYSPGSNEGREVDGCRESSRCWREGKVVRVFGTGQLISPKLIEIVGEHGDFDALWLDQEHGGLTMKDIELATMAARSYGMDHFVRLPATDYAAVMRPLEAGAGGVMFSMVRSPAEVEQAVRWAKFWPRGERGLNGGNRDGRYGLVPLVEYTARANAETFIGVQIETAGRWRQPRRSPRYQTLTCCSSARRT